MALHLLCSLGGLFTAAGVMGLRVFTTLSSVLTVALTMALFCSTALAKPLLISPEDNNLHKLAKGVGCYFKNANATLVHLSKQGEKLRAKPLKISDLRRARKQIKRLLRINHSVVTGVSPRGAMRKELRKTNKLIELYDTCNSLQPPGQPSPQEPGEAPPPDETAPPSPTISPTVTPPAPEPLPLAISLSQHGVDFIFDKPYPYGQFANGDFFVIGPATVTRITPDFENGRHGFEVNPNHASQQGFDQRIGGYDATRVPQLPLVVAPGSSVVKAISLSACSQTCLDTAAVLTVLAAPPPGTGPYFRPGYAGSEKTLIPVSALQPSLLPSLPVPPNAPSLSTIENRFKRVWLDHKSGWTGRAMHPLQNMPDYGAAIATYTNEAALRLMLDDSESEKLPALINFVQYGIDLHSMLSIGSSFGPDGGHSLGRLLVLSVSATVLDNDAIKQSIATRGLTNFHENGSVQVGATGQALWGQPGSEYAYWYNQVTDLGSRTVADPYGYIDGGYQPGGSYDACCNNQPFKGMALALRLMPALQDIWDYPPFLEYVDRTVTFGSYTQPDPCAPHDGNMANYGVTFGPDGLGGCIQGPGRFPQLHGLGADSGYYGSSFVNSMWSAYR